MIHKIRSLYPDYNFDYLYDKNMNFDCRVTTNIIIISLSAGWGILTSKEGSEGEKNIYSPLKNILCLCITMIVISLSDCGWGILTSKEGPEGGTPAEFEELPGPGVGVQLLLHHIVTEVTN